MSVDGTQILTPPPVGPQTVLFDMNSLIAQVVEAVKPVAIHHAEKAVELTGTRLQQNIDAVAADAGKNRKQIEEAVASVGQSFATELTKDVWLQRLLTALVVVGALIGGLVLLVFYLNGNPQARGAIGWLGALFGVPLTAAIHQAIGGPGAAKVPVTPTAVATTVLPGMPFISANAPMTTTTTTVGV